MPDENDIIYNTYGLDLVGLLQVFIDWVRSFFGFGTNTIANDEFWKTVSFWWDIYSVFAILLSALFLGGFIYAKIRYAQLSEIQSNMIFEEEAAWAHAYGGNVKRNERWSHIQKHNESTVPNDWRLGIIEADIFLEEVLRNNGYSGASIGEMLKSAKTSSFKTLQDAWDAHLVRNKIAHAGNDFVLTRRIANETIIKFERVFREFGAV